MYGRTTHNRRVRSKTQLASVGLTQAHPNNGSETGLFDWGRGFVHVVILLSFRVEVFGCCSE